MGTRVDETAFLPAGKEFTKFLHDLYKIHKARGTIIAKMDDILSKDVHTDDDNRQLALLTYKKICINKLEMYYFNQDKILERERVDLDEILFSNKKK